MCISSQTSPRYFFVEVLGDLEKGDITDTRARNSLVQSLAAKTPSYHSYANVPHTLLASNELLLERPNLEQ